MRELLEALDEAWAVDTGFLGKLRSGTFDQAAGEAYVALLGRVPPARGSVDAELVRLIWFAPMFLEWQLERAAHTETEAAELTRIASQVHEAVVEILGMP